MSNFDWHEYEGREVIERFPDDVVGFGHWREMLQSLRNYAEILGGSWREQLENQIILNIFYNFLGAVNTLNLSPPKCRVFVSHQKLDVVIAQQIANKAMNVN